MFDFKQPLSEVNHFFETEMFPEECEISQQLYNEAISKGELDRFSFDILGKRLIECPMTRIQNYYEDQPRLPKYMEKITHFSTLIFKIADYF